MSIQNYETLTHKMKRVLPSAIIDLKEVVAEYQHNPTSIIKDNRNYHNVLRFLFDTNYEPRNLVEFLVYLSQNLQVTMSVDEVYQAVIHNRIISYGVSSSNRDNPDLSVSAILAVLIDLVNSPNIISLSNILQNRYESFKLQQFDDMNF